MSWEDEARQYWDERSEETLYRVQRFIEQTVGYNSFFHFKLEWFGEEGTSVELPVMPVGLEIALVLASRPLSD